MVVQLTMTAWLVLEAGLLIRDRIRGKGSAARDQGTLWLNIVIITAAVVAAGLLTGAVKSAGPWEFGSTGLSAVGPARHVDWPGGPGLGDRGAWQLVPDDRGGGR